MYFKDFDRWNLVKQHVNNEDRKTSIRAGEVRWVAIGVNVGSEIDGKGASFTRPALIINVVGSTLALIVPMSTKVKEIPGYLPVTFQDRQVALCILQTRVISQKRILRRIGKLSERKVWEYKRVIKSFFSL